MKDVKRFRHEPAFMVTDKDGDYVLAVDYLICELELKDFQWGASVEADAGDEARSEVAGLKAENESLRKDAERYRALRRADIDTIHNGGLFVGLTPENIVINGPDLDYRCDAIMSSPENPS